MLGRGGRVEAAHALTGAEVDVAEDDALE
eukprot:COSAG04_NODE_22746_length_349_cov_2.324000_2_plen_28_part_01